MPLAQMLGGRGMLNVAAAVVFFTNTGRVTTQSVRGAPASTGAIIACLSVPLHPQPPKTGAVASGGQLLQPHTALWCGRLHAVQLLAVSR